MDRRPRRKARTNTPTNMLDGKKDCNRTTMDVPDPHSLTCKVWERNIDEILDRKDSEPFKERTFPPGLMGVIEKYARQPFDVDRESRQNPVWLETKYDGDGLFAYMRHPHAISKHKNAVVHDKEGFFVRPFVNELVGAKIDGNWENILYVVLKYAECQSILLDERGAKLGFEIDVYLIKAHKNQIHDLMNDMIRWIDDEGHPSPEKWMRKLRKEGSTKPHLISVKIVKSYPETMDGKYCFQFDEKGNQTTQTYLEFSKEEKYYLDNKKTDKIKMENNIKALKVAIEFAQTVKRKNGEMVFEQTVSFHDFNIGKFTVGKDEKVALGICAPKCSCQARWPSGMMLQFTLDPTQN